LVGAWLAASRDAARFVLTLIGFYSVISIVNLILVPWVLVQDRRIEIGPEGIDGIGKIGTGRLPWSYVRWVRVMGGRFPGGPVAFWIGGLRRRFVVSVNPAEHPESISRLGRAIARYAPFAKWSGRLIDTAQDPSGSIDGEFISVDSSWGSLLTQYSLVAGLAAVNFQVALVFEPVIIPSFTVRGAAVLVYFVMAATFVSVANWTSRAASAGAEGLPRSRVRALARFGGVSLVALSAAITVISLA
jgi:hypothetical protein